MSRLPAPASEQSAQMGSSVSGEAKQKLFSYEISLRNPWDTEPILDSFGQHLDDAQRTRVIKAIYALKSDERRKDKVTSNMLKKKADDSYDLKWGEGIYSAHKDAVRALAKEHDLDLIDDKQEVSA